MMVENEVMSVPFLHNFVHWFGAISSFILAPFWGSFGVPQNIEINVKNDDSHTKYDHK